ncbi:hypothetical protein [Candidatus Leptofilum sp.]|uniref:hypothetical protein n=1 Tax=Candidatus Leptofilum sp. TaxID=3241576 RepID=UPI003B5CDCB8
MDNLSDNIQQAAEMIEQTRQHVLAQQAALFATEPGKRPSIRKMEQSVWVNSHQPIAWPDWPPGLAAKVKAAVQKVMRRALQWYIDPIVQQQNQFNQATLQAISALAQEVAALQMQQSKQKPD